MISIERIRAEPELIREAMARRGEDVPIDRILELDRVRRSIIAETDRLRARRNEVSRELGRTKVRPPDLIEEMRGVGSQIREREARIRSAEEEIDALLLTIPNPPAANVPPGEDELGNVVVRRCGEPTTLPFEAKPHWEIGERLRIIDFERGVKLSGSRFFVLRGKGSRLQRALISWMLDLRTDEGGYEELYVPSLVTRTTAVGSSHLPKFADTMYFDSEDDLWLVPTAEMPITNLHRDEILPPGTLPLNYVAHSPSFRREKASAGRDTRGIKRVHQFEKVEMYKLTEPEGSEAALQELVADAEEVCVRLGIPHRVVKLCAGDLGFAAVESYDVEMWAPGCGEWLEVSSCSNCADFQARRAGIRYRPAEGARPRFVHTLNGSGLGLPRVVIAVLENFQQEDGSVLVPEVLRPYTGFDRIG